MLLEISANDAHKLGVPAGRTLHLDRARRAVTGDLVWVEIVRHGSTQRLIRRYALDGDWVTLSVPDGDTPSIMRRRAELLVLGVLDDDICHPVPDPAVAGDAG